MGCRVVAVEPQDKCFKKLKSAFGDDKDTVLLKKAMGQKQSLGEMAICSSDVLSSLAPEFVERVKQSERFGDVNWDATERVEITTLDQTISTHGKPRFLKIDVEGYELEVLRGLSQPVKYISIEWAPELTDKTTQCIEYLVGLGNCEFNISWGESMKFARSKWITRKEIENVMNEFRDDSWLFADIYVHFPSLA
jgi:FkbM family methyltransferase